MKPEHETNIPAIGFAQQIIIYAKNWYGHSGDTIADIKTLMSLYTGTDEEYIPDRDVREMIVDTFVNYVSHPHDLKEGMANALGWGALSYLHKQYKSKPEDFLLGKLAIIKGKYVDLSKKFKNISFHEAEYTEVEEEAPKKYS